MTSDKISKSRPRREREDMLKPHAETLAMMMSAIVGGYYGARFARYLPPTVLRWFVVALSATVTVAFFLRKY